MLLLLAASRALGEVFERLRQSALVGEVLAGILLGPYVLGVALPPGAGVPEALTAVGDLGVFLLVYLAGLEMRIDEVGQSLRGGGVLVGAVGFALPFLALFGLSSLLGLSTEAAMFAGLVSGLTALPVSVRILMDVGLSTHTVGRTIVACAVLSELTALTGLGLILSIRGAPSFEAALVTAGITLVKTALLVSLVLTFVQAFRLTTGSVPAAQRFFRGAVGLLRGRESVFGVATLFVLVFAGVSQVLGLHFVVGAFFGGLLLSPQILGEWNFKQIERTTSAVTFGLLAPIFFGLIGLRFAPDALLRRPDLVVALVGAGFASKYAAGLLASRAIGQPPAAARAVGTGLTMHGVLELVIANLALELGIFDTTLFSSVVLSSLVSTIAAPVLLRRRAAALEPALPGGPPAAAPSAGVTASRPREATGGPVRPRPVLLGGGRVALEVARSLGECTVLERSEDQARFLRLMLTGVEVLVGDAALPADLRRAGVGSGSVVVAMTDDAAANEAAVREAVKLGAARVIARAEHAGDADKLVEAGADAVVCVPEEAGAALVKALYPLGESMAEVHLAKTSPAVGRSVADLELPLGVALQSITRSGRVLVPSHDLVLLGRDSIIMSGPPPSLDAAREALLGGGANGHALSAVAYLPVDTAACALVLGEVGQVAAASGGALAGVVPDAEQGGGPLEEAERALREFAPAATAVAATSLGAADLDRMLARLEVPRTRLAGAAAPPLGSGLDPSMWVVALPATCLGKAEHQIGVRKAATLPVVLGVPVYLAARGRPPETVTALIDGTEGAEAAGMLACAVALASPARLMLVVVSFEDDAEPREQADFVQNYARTAGLGTVDVMEIAEPGPHAVERALRAQSQLIVAPSSGRAVYGRTLLASAMRGTCSVLLV